MKINNKIMMGLRTNAKIPEGKPEDLSYLTIARNIANLRKNIEASFQEPVFTNCDLFVSDGYHSGIPLEHPIYQRGRIVSDHFSSVASIYEQIEEFERGIKEDVFAPEKHSLAEMFRRDLGRGIERELLEQEPSGSSDIAVARARFTMDHYRTEGSLRIRTGAD